ncbi:hypothetical protein F4083_11320 [Candidatus Poribacteria bacterium]|nr:hypothetical protein [Candidatus Poribacteria bacterium]MYI94885.1 hypothetical protein [Candidatus Poribacteria bacterium]
MLYEFTKLELQKEEFDNLVFMGDPPWWTGINKYPLNWDRWKQPYLPIWNAGRKIFRDVPIKPSEAILKQYEK